MRSLKNTFITLFRIALGLGLLHLLLLKVDPKIVQEVYHATIDRWPFMVLGIFLTFVGLCVGAVRWRCILNSQGIRLRLLRVSEIFFIGQFFNAFFLGACGGDVARAYFIMKETHNLKTETASSVFLDRAVGLFVLILFCCVMIVVRIPLFLDHEGTRVPGLLMVIFLVAAVVGFFALFRQNLFEHWRFFQHIETKTRLGPLIRRAYDTFYLYRKNKPLVGITFILSLLNTGFLTLACWAFGQAIGVTAGLVDHFTLFPIITVLAAVPLTPGSLGVREWLFVTLYAAIGVTSSHAFLLSLLVYASGAFWSVLGGLLFLCWALREGRSVHDFIGKETVFQSPEERP
jgi:uncharacterized protein (TIRG00374 family)